MPAGQQALNTGMSFPFPRLRLAAAATDCCVRGGPSAVANFEHSISNQANERVEGAGSEPCAFSDPASMRALPARRGQLLDCLICHGVREAARSGNKLRVVRIVWMKMLLGPHDELIGDRSSQLLLNELLNVLDSAFLHLLGRLDVHRNAATASSNQKVKDVRPFATIVVIKDDSWRLLLDLLDRGIGEEKTDEVPFVFAFVVQCFPL